MLRLESRIWFRWNVSSSNNLSSFCSSSRYITFFRSTKKVIIIELTCPCEENMSQWHEEKSQKYYPLCCSIRSNGWSVYFYAIEVGARGFCAESVRSCLRSLGFNNKLCRKTLQTLSSVSLRYSFGCVEILKAGLYPIQYLCLTQNQHRKSLT